MFNLPSLSDNEDKNNPFVNRIRKNYRHIRKFAKRTVTNCFRIYDREIREYPIAIDFYAERFLIYYFSSRRENEIPTEEFVEEVENTLRAIFGNAIESIVWKSRFKSKETRQYEKLDETGHFFSVFEYGIQFKVNLSDYLDSGLFLDHRETRRWIGAQAKGKRVLNLFAYTCSFSVHAAVAGASYTKSVDMSNTYVAWGRDNFILNGIALKNHPIVRADCLKFLDHAVNAEEKYDIIVIDPPTISRSKKMDQLFDIQADYIYLIQMALKLLNKEGFILFSTNSRKFVFDQSLFLNCHIREVTEKTLPIDFHDPKIHRCWQISIS